MTMPYDNDSTPTNKLSDGTVKKSSSQWQNSEPPITALVEEVAAENECDPLELPPLQHYIDVDALDALLAPPEHNSRPPVRVSFEYGGCGVTVDSDGGLNIQLSASDDKKSD